MAGFPSLPRVNGDTDDDASIHLNRTVGRAQPLTNKRSSIVSEVDRKIYAALHQTNQYDITEKDENENEEDADGINGSHHELNNSFERYQQDNANGYASEEDDDYQYNDTTEVESDDELEIDSDYDDRELQALNEKFQALKHFNTPRKPQRSPYSKTDIPIIQNQNPKDDLIGRYKRWTVPHLQPPSDNVRDHSPVDSTNQPHYGVEEKEDGHDNDEEIEEEEEEQESNLLASSTGGNASTKNNLITSIMSVKLPISNWKVYLLYAFISFVPTFLILIYQKGFNYSENGSPTYHINTRLQKETANSINKLLEITNKLENRQEFIENNHQSDLAAINSKFDFINNKFDSIETSIQETSKQIKDFKQVVSNTKVTNINTNSTSVEELRSFIVENLSSIKQEILNDLLESLPQLIPVYIKHDKIHFSSQFHKYLYNFIDKYMENNPNNQTLQLNHSNNNDTLTNKSYLKKDELERYLDKRFLFNNKFIIDKFNNLVDNLNLAASSNTNSTEDSFTVLKESTNKLLLNQLLEIFSQGSVKVNYADYSIGARILGFLTRSNLKSKSTSNAYKLFFGWYDYLQSKHYWKYSANSALLDNDQYWTCQSTSENPCSVGIRLSNSIILTDLIIDFSTIDTQEDFEGEISVWIKPNNYKLGEKLLKYLTDLKFSDSTVRSTDKYLRKFFKVKKFNVIQTFDREGKTNRLKHIKMPISMINLGVPTRDIYIEFRGTSTNIANYEISNIKAYGITELNANRYDKQFSLVIDKMYQEGNQDNLFEENDIVEDYNYGIYTNRPYELLDNDEVV
ncbi:uncharacterized protein RJT21DRAFT_41539 [Scheffersomyces amazonensis]|uniref:uncharacterized protein n=1 Tax=Scheffersomyces amazonensis TaxID=1078765 RepID=UPI00315D5887